MKVSLSWIRFLNDKYQCSADPAPDGVDKLVEKIGAQLGAVEEVIDLGKKYQGIVVAKVVQVDKHPNADKLTVCLIDDGKAAKNVKRTLQGLIQVVCGAPNVKAGLLVAYIPPGVALPSSYDKDPLVLETRDIRGVASNGMLASPAELAIGESHEGLLVIDEDVKPGTPFAKVYGLDDYIIDIENKMFTHRPDLFGILGVAREIAGIQHQVFKSPSWYREDAKLPPKNGSGLKLEIKNQLPELVPRFCAVVISHVEVKASPVWLQTELARIGQKPINNIVDLTNYFMFETAQPLHAYDYDKVVALDPEATHATLVVREPKAGEELSLLNGRVIKLQKGTIVISSATRAIGLGGVKGGADTEIDENTKNIILEAATFDMNATRHSALLYGEFSEAAIRFTKGQSPRQNAAVICKAVEDVRRLAGGRVASGLIDVKNFATSDSGLKVSVDFINRRLGLSLPAAEMKKLLENVEFAVKLTGDNLLITPPFWRTDIEIPEDIVEEVGRLYGYDHLPAVLPHKDLRPATANPILSFKSRLRDILASAGANEGLTYSFIHDSLLEVVGQDKESAYHLRNALSPGLQSYRLSLTPSLLEKVQPNIRAGFDQFALFEINKAHNKRYKEKNEPGLPKEFELLALVFACAGKDVKAEGAPYYQARVYLDFIAARLDLQLSYKPLPKENGSQVFKPFDPSRSSIVSEAATGMTLGIIGEYGPLVRQRLKLPPRTAGFEIDVENLQSVSKPHPSYKPLNRYPAVTQDFCLRSNADIPYSELTAFMDKELSKLTAQRGYIYELAPLDIFQRPNDHKYKQTTWRITLMHSERTLTTDETNQLLDALAREAKQKLKADRV